MAAIPVKKLRENLAEALNRARYKNERIIVTKNNKAAAAIVPIQDLELLEKIEEKIDLQEIDLAWDIRAEWSIMVEGILSAVLVSRW